MPEISVIIPTLNESLYVEECLMSALADCPGCVEFIVIDDGSTDDTVAIVERIASTIINGPHILLKRNTGKGVAAARGYGISLASGKYITFLDADDTVEKGAYRLLLKETANNNADVICFGNDEVSGKLVRPCFFDSFSSDHKQRIRDCLSLKTSPYLCTKLIKKELLDKVVIPPGNLAEDWAISVQLFLLTEKVKFLNKVLYHYRILKTSLSRNTSMPEICKYKAMEEKKNINFICDILESKRLTEEYRNEIAYRKTNVKRCLFPILKKRYDYLLWKNTFPEINRAIYFNPYVRNEYLFKHFLSQLRILHLVYPFLLIKRKVLNNEAV